MRVNSRLFQTPDSLLEKGNLTQRAGLRNVRRRHSESFASLIQQNNTTQLAGHTQQHYSDLHFVSKASYMVGEEEFEAGDRDSRVIQQSNFTPSLHCHQ